MSSRTCQHCGCGDIDVDAGRGDAVCTGCGSVLEEHIIVSEVQFQENAHGGSNAIGQFVGADGKGSKGLAAGFHTGVGKESRELTLRNAKKKINWLAQQLRLNQHCVDTAHNFFKMALSRGLTRGRRSNQVIGACLYITCRTEGTPHMLIDFSDILLVDVCELGRTYMALANALCINIPIMDPCVYVLRYANKLELGGRTHEVSVTAARLMQRMKRDWLHMGRRPSGLCGAALLMATRLHGFNRTVDDVIKIVRVHQSTVKKRLSEFKQTPSSSLTVEEFMNVDLEDEMDPPAFTKSRKKDKERIAQLNEGEVTLEIKALQKEIDKQLDDRKKRLQDTWNNSIDEPPASPESGDGRESQDVSLFVQEHTLELIRDCVGEDLGPAADTALMPPPPSGMGVSRALLGLTASVDGDGAAAADGDDPASLELDISGIDDDEIDSYIMSPREIRFKTKLWFKLNADFLKEEEVKRQRAEEERLQRERDGKPEKKKRGPRRKKTGGLAASTAEEAIEKMLHEKKISNKINYDVLRELTGAADTKVDLKRELKPDVAELVLPASRKRHLSGSEAA
ncbi:transcription factor IIIB 90 kDa subunit-like, partial [Pollicipes pollicipes]|uniref:transcription factor IIIB 90 kDa subunit-like n=1 Tax=Pollicipes pollicipes TaxID=41117 RepID=UPI001884DACD